jgi:hypothetical protein
MTLSDSLRTVRAINSFDPKVLIASTCKSCMQEIIINVGRMLYLNPKRCGNLPARELFTLYNYVSDVSISVNYFLVFVWVCQS